jgi:Ca-activated chloride channel family protein
MERAHDGDAMRVTTLAGLAAAGMLLSGVGVYSMTPKGGLSLPAPAAVDDDERDDTPVDEDDDGPAGSRFSSGDTLRVTGRLGHGALAAGERGETLVLLEVRAEGEGRARTKAPVNLALVIDRSGSMRGERMLNAQNAAVRAVEQLSDGDTVSVVSFDTETSRVVPKTVIDSFTRSRVIGDIRSIRLGGDTCISCGIEDGLAALGEDVGRVQRMIVLSDGDANHGVRDVPGFRSIAQRAREHDVSITTIGVSLEYNERILTALSAESNGHHYFVERETDLGRVFEAEAATLSRTVASQAEAIIELGDRVELVRVYDRTFSRAGSTVQVPLGSFSTGDVKTVLLGVRVRERDAGAVDVAKVTVSFRDLLEDEPARVRGRLAAEVRDGRAGELDPVVTTRLQRSLTADALKEANELFQQGKTEEARARLDASRRQLGETRAQANEAPAPSKDAKEIGRDLDFQDSALEDAEEAFRPGAAEDGAAAGAKRNAEREFNARQ